MKTKICLCFSTLLLFCSTLNAQFFKDMSGSVLTIGVKTDKLSNEDVTTFDHGLGVSMESFISMKKVSAGLFGFDYYENQNIVGDSKVLCQYYTFYFFPLDWRFNIITSSSGRANLYLGAAIAPQLMKVEGTHGTDYSWIYAASLGFQFAVAKHLCLQLQARPYLVSGNQFDKTAGFEMKFSIGGLIYGQ
jgi:hypothetical protein